MVFRAKFCSKLVLPNIGKLTKLQELNLHQSFLIKTISGLGKLCSSQKTVVNYEALEVTHGSPGVANLANSVEDLNIVE